MKEHGVSAKIAFVFVIYTKIKKNLCIRTVTKNTCDLNICTEVQYVLSFLTFLCLTFFSHLSVFAV